MPFVEPKGGATTPQDIQWAPIVDRPQWVAPDKDDHALTFTHTSPTIIYLDGKGGSHVLSDDEAPRIDSPREEAIIKALLTYAQSHFDATTAPRALYPPLGSGGVDPALLGRPTATYPQR